MTTGIWLVFDVGCIECGESSDVVGLFDSEDAANAVADRLNETMSFTSGQHSYEVFRLDHSLNAIREEKYR